MKELDLTEAIDAAAEDLNGALDEADWVHAVPCDQVESAIRAALPHILDTLAEHAAGEEIMHRDWREQTASWLRATAARHEDEEE